MRFSDSESYISSTIGNEMIMPSSNENFWYEHSDYVVNIFSNLVIKPFNEHPITEAWQREVLDCYNNKNFDNIKAIVGRGQANFNEPFNELTSADRVLVYCYDNMYQHVNSQIYILEKHKNIFDKYIFDFQTKVLFIDFGCGPLSSGIALAMYYAKSPRRNSQSIKFNYIGLDKAESMLEKAREFSQYSGLFHSHTTFDFLNTYASYPSNFYEILCQCIDSYLSSKTLIILNFSYFFASPSLSICKLIHFIKRLLARYLYNPICLIFQNPQGEGLNENWNLFQR